MTVFQYSTEQLSKIRDSFFEELVKASEEAPSSISFIKNILPEKSTILDDQTFQAMVIGGRVFKKALFKKDRAKIVLLNAENENLPLFENEQIFLSFVAKHLDPNVTYLAVNFAYGLKQIIRDNLIDGIKLGSGGKGQKFTDLTGKLVGKEIENYILKKNNRIIKVSLANDTICLLLSDLNSKNRMETIAGIVGAGTNFSFFIDEKTAVNLESGNFNKFPQTETGKIIDKSSTNPGQHLFEKEVSGTYLYQHYNGKAKIRSTKELSLLAKQGDIIAQKLLERSTSLIACQIAGICRFKNLK
jgi:hexokinase